jgi:pyrroline-5-carboxylate reductase
MSLETAGPLLLIGCGKMGGALLAGWLEGGLPPGAVTVVEPQAEGEVAAGVRTLRALDEVDPDTGFEVVVLAIKPQQMEPALAQCKGLVGAGSAGGAPVVLSIAAGRTIAGYEAGLGAGVPVVRAMPNTPAAVGRGISVLVANDAASAAQRALCQSLMESVGEAAWVEDEALMDAVTAVSGGGPAYVFLLIETLAEAGAAAGLPAELAERLARVTVAGAGELARRSSEPASTLRENVTSPGGTTLEALKVLMADDGLRPLMIEAIAAATRRSRELAQ